MTSEMFLNAKNVDISKQEDTEIEEQEQDIDDGTIQIQKKMILLMKNGKKTEKSIGKKALISQKIPIGMRKILIRKESD